MRRVISLFREIAEDEGYGLSRENEQTCTLEPRADDEAREPIYFVQLMAYLHERNHKSAEPVEVDG
jgi:hypothetical protein